MDFSKPKVKIPSAQLRDLLNEKVRLTLRVDELLRRNTELVEEVRAAKRESAGVVEYEFKHEFVYLATGDGFSKITDRMGELSKSGWETLHVKDAVRTDNGAPGVALFCKRVVAPDIKEKS